MQHPYALSVLRVAGAFHPSPLTPDPWYLDIRRLSAPPAASGGMII